jgi:hypothetical protein
MDLLHVELKDANDFVARLHRHHKPVLSHRFSIGARHGYDLVGVAICGRPVAKAYDYRAVVEVLRLCTDGTPNACSFLYGASARAAKALGYIRVQTYILASETGGSLVAAGWTRGHTTTGGDWNRPSRGGRRVDQPMEPKVHWYKDL